MSTPIFSICHATARMPRGWEPSMNCWMANADEPSKVEYILSIHPDNVPPPLGPAPYFIGSYFTGSLRKFYNNLPIRMVYYDGLNNSVHGWNVAASQSTGNILILNADDFFPPPHWDSLLIRALVKSSEAAWESFGVYGSYEVKLAESVNPIAYSEEDEYAIHVSTGNPDIAWDRRLMALGIISRPLYSKWGYALYPEYESMDSDVDMTEHAYQDGVVIQAFDLVFEHRHPAFGKAEDDEVYRKQNRPEAYALGHEILERRRKDRFAK